MSRAASWKWPTTSSLLTNRAVAAEKIDSEAASRQVETARGQKAHTPETMAQREKAAAQGRARSALRGGYCGIKIANCELQMCKLPNCDFNLCREDFARHAAIGFLLRSRFEE